MDLNQILDAMEETATAVFEDNEDYVNDGKRGVLAVYMRNEKNKDQWDGSSRSFGVNFRDYGYEDELVINNGVNFDALVHGKIAFSRRTGKDSGTNYYQVLGNESWWKGSVMSDDSQCICAFAGFSGDDDRAIAFAGIDAYESQKGPSEFKKEKDDKTGSLLKTASLTRAEGMDAPDDEVQSAHNGLLPPRAGGKSSKSAGTKAARKPAQTAAPKKTKKPKSSDTGSKAGKKSKKGK
ncbi:MAG: hypothetical protein LBH73_06450 [Spirochaetaceae bacterium]|jgi:hypothetical protein|nr:hypothetical protein [Spirochaetaceae bacterium]